MSALMHDEDLHRTDSVSTDDWLLFHREYYNTDRYNGIGSKQRFGQAFCNRFNINDAVLFYMREDAEAIQYICDCYVYMQEPTTTENI